MRSRGNRGQAVTEVALCLLVLVPMIIGGLFLAEASMFRLKATEAATEPMWDATAYPHNSYTGVFNRTPGAVLTATAKANARSTPRQLLYTSASAPKVTCTAGSGLGLTIGPTSGVYSDNGGMSCASSMVIDPKGMTRFFADQGPEGFFKEPIEKMVRTFTFCQTRKCQPFVMAIGDWGLTNLNGEDSECALTMSGCANSGFYDFSKSIYEAHRTGAGTLNDAYIEYVEKVVQQTPADLAKLTNFQMSFRGEESGFIEKVPVSEGESDWHTTPSFGAWEPSYAARSSSFLGR